MERKYVIILLNHLFLLVDLKTWKCELTAHYRNTHLFFCPEIRSITL